MIRAWFGEAWFNGSAHRS